MRKMKYFLLLMLGASLSVFSQNEVDALRYSRTMDGGTARFLSMGGAFGALGADFSVINTNPAGLGLYKKSEFTISPALFFGKTNSDFYGNSTYDSRSNFNLSNVGFVYASEPRSSKGMGFRNFQLGFGLIRSNNFNNRMLMEGFNPNNSIIDTYVNDANGIYYLDIEDNLYGQYGFDLTPAWYTYMMDTIDGSQNTYYGAVPPGGGVMQRKEINSWGSMNDFVLAFSANFGDRFYLGTSFNFPSIRYFEESFYTEYDAENAIDDFDELSIYESLRTRGNGFNMKFGMIVRVTDFFRLGGSVHSPTWFYNMRDEWYTDYSTRFDNSDTYSRRSPLGNYNYELETPWKATGGVSFVLWRMALISAEYEYKDYSESRLRSSGYSYFDENSNIQNTYTVTHNFKAGVELRMGYFAVRGGANYLTSPFANDINDGKRFTFSGGLGYRDKHFFMDLAYVRSRYDEDYYFYGNEEVQFEPVKNTYLTHNVVMTVGLRF